ncbi:MAG: hypothetical protein K5871_10910 [Lachnospiraceae bacterium]|nr:hypothetical protein [Lachnospiraceae bacterium]
MKRIYRMIPVLIILLLFGGCTSSLDYSETVNEGPWTAALYREGGEAFVTGYEWDGTEEGLRIEPNEVEGCLVTRYGGYFGRGLPMPFSISVSDSVFVNASEIPADADVEDVTFTMVITNTIYDVFINDLEGFFCLEDENGNLSYYRLLVDVELDPDNAAFYMEEGRLYERDREGDIEIRGVCNEEVEGFDPGNRETVPSDDVHDEEGMPDEDLQPGDEGDVSGVSGIRDVYSSDGNVCLRQDYLHLTSVIIDGDEEIPVDIAFGEYGPIIEKFDADGDGKEEYLIAECEGTGTGYCVYGLVIVREKDGAYYSDLYDWRRFSDYIEENVTFRYNEETREVTVYEILPPFMDRWEGVTIKLKREAVLEDIVWSDIIRIGFEDGRVIISAPSGYIFDDSPAPDYEQAALVKLGLLFHEDGSFGIYVNSISEDEAG